MTTAGTHLAATRRRAARAARLLALFLLQFLVAPMAHLANHAPDHTHGPDGTVIERPHPSHEPRGLAARLLLARVQWAARHAHAHDAREPHAHVGGLTLSIAQDPDVATVSADEGEQGPDLAHGKGAAAHFGLALLTSGGPALAASPSVMERVAPPPSRAPALPSRHRQAHRPRGPPARV